ncbi:hypothetical protein P7K49_014694, partial [Saguinus oedipus]
VLGTPLQAQGPADPWDFTAKTSTNCKVIPSLAYHLLKTVDKENVAPSFGGTANMLVGEEEADESKSPYFFREGIGRRTLGSKNLEKSVSPGANEEGSHMILASPLRRSPQPLKIELAVQRDKGPANQSRWEWGPALISKLGTRPYRNLKKSRQDLPYGSLARMSSASPLASSPARLPMVARLVHAQSLHNQ